MKNHQPSPSVFFNLRFEAHVEHSVSFVEDKECNPCEICGLHLDHVDDPSRRCHDQFGTSFQGLTLLPLTAATVRAHHADVVHLTEPVHAHSWGTTPTPRRSCTPYQICARTHQATHQHHADVLHLTEPAHAHWWGNKPTPLRCCTPYRTCARTHHATHQHHADVVVHPTEPVHALIRPHPNTTQMFYT